MDYYDNTFFIQKHRSMSMRCCGFVTSFSVVPNPIDDLMFRKMAEDKEFCQEILQVVLGDDKLTVKESVPQWTGTNLQGRSVILDAKCVRGDGTQTDIEVQKADDDDHLQI
jgi:hypothetical protein